MEEEDDDQDDDILATSILPDNTGGTRRPGKKGDLAASKRLDASARRGKGKQMDDDDKSDMVSHKSYRSALTARGKKNIDNAANLEAT